MTMPEEIKEATTVALDTYNNIDFKNKSKKSIEFIEHLEKMKNLDEQKKNNNIINLKEKKKYVKKPFKKKRVYKKAK